MRKAGVKPVEVGRGTGCDCEDWRQGAKSISELILMDSIRVVPLGYTGKPFRFCPWCGKKLVEVEDENDK